jgi:phage portal protein BeeE
MKFIPLNFITSLLGGQKVYQQNKSLFSQSQVLSGRPEFLNPDSWDAYNIYITTPQLYAVIQRRGYLLASGQWKHYKNTNGKVSEVEKSEFVKLLENPNPLMKGNDLIRQWNENKCVYGNNYEFVLKAFSTAVPSALNNLPPAEMQIKTTGKVYKQTKIEDIIEFYELIQNGQMVDKFLPSEINHSRVVNGKNAVKGESPMIPLHMPISNIRGAYGFRNVIINKKGALGILSNNAKDSSGAIPLNDTERQRLEKEYQRLYGIGDNQIQTIMTNASLSYQAMTYPTKDLMLFEEIDEDFLTIIDNYGLNANIFSRSKGSTFENLNEGLKQAYQSTIIPEAEELALNRSEMFGLLQKGEWLELDFSHIPVLQENSKEKAEILEKKANAINTLIQSGVYTKTEIQQIITF